MRRNEGVSVEIFNGGRLGVRNFRGVPLGVWWYLLALMVYLVLRKFLLQVLEDKIQKKQLGR